MKIRLVMQWRETLTGTGRAAMPPTKLACLFTELSQTAIQAHEHRNEKSEYGDMCFALAAQWNNLLEREKKNFDEADDVMRFNRKVLLTYIKGYIAEDVAFIENLTPERVCKMVIPLIELLRVVSSGIYMEDTLRYSQEIYHAIGTSCRLILTETKQLPSPTPQVHAESREEKELPPHVVVKHLRVIDCVSSPSR